MAGVRRATASLATDISDKRCYAKIVDVSEANSDKLRMTALVSAPHYAKFGGTLKRAPAS